MGLSYILTALQLCSVTP